MSLIGIEKIKTKAKNFGGICLSTKYINSKTKYKFKCKNGHIFFKTATGLIHRNSFCAKCSGKSKVTIEECKLLAKKNNGKLLSKKIIRAKSKVLWLCELGHKFETTPSSVQQGSWCPDCGGSKKLEIEQLQELAKKRGGKLLSKKYKNSQTKMRWQCSNGHIWDATTRGIKNKGQWCPECVFYYSEALCRTTMEQLFNKKFPRSYPEWLINSNYQKMELDGYCSEIKLGFEYNGPQHYKTGFFYSTKKNLFKRIDDDKEKLRLCKKNGVCLLIFSYKDNLLELPNLIKKKLENSNFSIKNIDFSKKIDFNKVYQHVINIKTMQKIAKDRGGKCLSKKYINANQKLKWQCSEGHTWYATPASIKNQKKWCRKCAAKSMGFKRRLGISKMQDVAKERGGVCLSKNYINTATSLKWRCSKGHTWNARVYNILTGTWCPECGGSKQLTLDEMRKIALSKGGDCLSEKYFNTKTKLKWICKNNHIFYSTPNDVKYQNTWCQKCK